MSNSRQSTNRPPTSDVARDIAKRFVDARLNARPLTGFPGAIPTTLDEAYIVQDGAIELWQQRISGWKVGRIPVAIEQKFGIDRIAGPIFAPTIHEVKDGSTIEMPIFVGGFAAVEAEFIAVIARDAPPDQLSWTLDEASEMIADLRIGIEIASSPLATINELGPAVVVSDFGNNLGLVVGPSISNWRTRPLETMMSATRMDGRDVGNGGAFKLTGGFVRSVQFLLELTARRGFPLRAGDMVATGQTTGVHNIAVGQTSIVNFGEDGRLGVTGIAAKPVAGSAGLHSD